MRIADPMDAFKFKQAIADMLDGPIVEAALRDITAGDFDSDHINDVLKRRAGTIADYRRVKEALEIASAVVRHARVA